MIFLVDKKFDFSFYLLVHRSEFFSLSFFYNYFGFFHMCWIMMFVMLMQFFWVIF